MNLTTVPAGQLLDPPPASGGGAAVDLRGVVVVGVEGDVDLHTGPALRRALEDLLAPVSGGRDDEGASAAEEAAPAELLRAVVVDLTAVGFIDSFALGVLVQGHHLARRSGRAYALVGVHPMMHTLFGITGLARVLPLHRDVAAAVGSLTSRG